MVLKTEVFLCCHLRKESQKTKASTIPSLELWMEKKTPRLSPPFVAGRREESSLAAMLKIDFPKALDRSDLVIRAALYSAVLAKAAPKSWDGAPAKDLVKASPGQERKRTLAFFGLEGRGSGKGQKCGDTNVL